MERRSFIDFEFDCKIKVSRRKTAFPARKSSKMFAQESRFCAETPIFIPSMDEDKS